MNLASDAVLNLPVQLFSKFLSLQKFFCLHAAVRYRCSYAKCDAYIFQDLRFQIYFADYTTA